MTILHSVFYLNSKSNSDIELEKPFNSILNEAQPW